VVSDVLVKGGAGVANDRLITPRGVVTEITEEQAEALRANPVFAMHEKNGFVQIGEAYVDPDKRRHDRPGYFRADCARRPARRFSADGFRGRTRSTDQAGEEVRPTGFTDMQKAGGRQTLPAFYL